VTGETSDEIYPKIEAEVLKRFGEEERGTTGIDGLGVMGVGLEEQELERLALEAARL